MRRAWLSLIVCAISLVLTSCATHSSRVRSIEQLYVTGESEKALSALEQLGYPQRDRVLYLLDRAMLMRMSHRYTDSNAAFEEAKSLIAELSATSVSESVVQLTLNDAASSYVGSPLEQVLIHVYEAFNYLEMGQVEQARVEALQLDQLIRAFHESRDEAQLGSIAFAHYLSGIIFEDLAEWSDAMIAYRKAYDAYTQNSASPRERLPRSLQYDLLRLSEHLGLNEEMRRYQGEFGISSWTSLAEYRQLGEIVLFFNNGLVPIKQEHSEIVPVLGHGQLVRVSLPQYHDRGRPASSARLTIEDQQWHSELAMDIGTTARFNLEKAMPGIIARTAARNIVKYQAAREAGQQNELAGLMLNVFNVLTESADTRSWSTLPAEIQIARAALPRGDHNVAIDVLGGTSGPGQHRQIQLHLEAGETRYLSHQWTPFYIPVMRH